MSTSNKEKSEAYFSPLKDTTNSKWKNNCDQLICSCGTVLKKPYSSGYSNTMYHINTKHKDELFIKEKQEKKSQPSILEYGLSSKRIKSMHENTIKEDVKEEMKKQAHVVHVEEVYRTKWLSMKNIQYEDEDGQVHGWDAVERTTKQQGKCDAVCILPLLHLPGRDTQIVLIVQYRPALDQYIVECPAGLVDANENEEEAAIRELKEETGYVVDRIVSKSPATVSDPGISNATSCMIIVNIDGTVPGNVHPIPDRSDEETSMRLLIVPLKDLLATLHTLTQEEALGIDAQLYCYALGLASAAASNRD